jgi:hypothetical protein
MISEDPRDRERAKRLGANRPDPHLHGSTSAGRGDRQSGQKAPAHPFSALPKDA